MKWLKRFWNWLKNIFATKFEEPPIPDWPKAYLCPNRKEGQTVNCGFSNNYITITNENRLFFDIDNDKEMDYDNPIRDRKITANGESIMSGDLVKLKNQSVEFTIYDLPVGEHIIRTDLVEYNYISGGKFVSHHHVRAVFKVIIEK